MKIKIKKTLSIFMAFMMLLCAVPFMANAEDSEVFTEGYYIYTIENDKATITDCDNSISGDVVIPDTLGGYPVVAIGDEAFYECASITRVIIPDSVISIGSYAFCLCTGLTSINIPDGVKKIDVCTFHSCTGLTSITLPSSVETIYMYAFAYCTSLSSVTIPEGVTIIGEDAFVHCPSLKSVTLPKSLAKIYTDAFGRLLKYSEIEQGYVTGEMLQGFTIIGYKGSEAEKYANQYDELKFVAINEVVNSDTGAYITYLDGVYSDDITLNVSLVTEGVAFNVLNTEKSNCQKLLFDITTTVGGEKVQPNGSVWVKIPLPKGYDPKNTTVYYITNDGKLEEMKSSIVDGYIIFETTHFSYYAVVEETEPSQPDNPSETCPCNCHKKGIVNFFFKILLFFQRIFGQNKTCKCGIAHY